MTPESAAATMAALADPIRLLILKRVIAGRDSSTRSPPHPDKPDCLCPYLDVQRNMEGIDASKFSYHLKRLRDADLIAEYRLGKRVYCEANLGPLEQAGRFLFGKWDQTSTKNRRGGTTRRR
jgi:DNA-binding transcriptional ArsR family regulator